MCIVAGDSIDDLSDLDGSFAGKPKAIVGKAGASLSPEHIIKLAQELDADQTAPDDPISGFLQRNSSPGVNPSQDGGVQSWRREDAFANKGAGEVPNNVADEEEEGMRRGSLRKESLDDTRIRMPLQKISSAYPDSVDDKASGRNDIIVMHVTLPAVDSGSDTRGQASRRDQETTHMSEGAACEVGAQRQGLDSSGEGQDGSVDGKESDGGLAKESQSGLASHQKQGEGVRLPDALLGIGNSSNKLLDGLKMYSTSSSGVAEPVVATAVALDQGRESGEGQVRSQAAEAEAKDWKKAYDDVRVKAEQREAELVADMEAREARVRQEAQEMEKRVRAAAEERLQQELAKARSEAGPPLE